MKSSKRKRSAKAAPAVDASGVDAVIAETPASVGAVEPTAESSPTAVAALAAEPAAAEPVVDAAVETTDVIIEAVAEFADATAETVVVEMAEPAAAEPAQVVDPIVVLAANCSVKDAAALKTSLCALAQQSTDVTLDVSAVERVDTATMQLLCAFVRDRSGRNQGVSWRGKSQALQDAVRLLGVGALLGFEPTGVAA